MQCNVGNTDRVLRIAAGIIILGVGAYLQEWWGVIGAIPLVTGLVRWCPAYLPIGLNTNKK